MKIDRHMVHRDDPLGVALRVAGRFLAGLPLDGNRTTNATFLHRGTQRTGTHVARWWGRQEPGRWAMLAGWQRAAVRWAALATLAGWWRARQFTEWTIGLAAGALLGYWMFRQWQAWQIREHTDRYVRPLHTVLASALGMPELTRPGDWLDVPPGFRSQDPIARIDLPETFTGADDERKLVTSIVCSKLGLSDGEITTSFHTVGDPYVEFTHAPLCPEHVTVADVRELMEAAPPSAPIMGLGRGSKKIDCDLDSEYPHVLVSMSTNGGKSTLLKGQFAQHLRNGAHVIILDVRRNSHRWARGLPNVTYCRDIEDIHDELLGLLAECDRRNAKLDEDGDDADVGPRLIIGCEELNTMTKRLQRYWDKTRAKSDPRISPAIDVLLELLCMGRYPKMHIYAVAQLATAKAIGGPEARENFGVRILSRYTQNAWRMLVPEVWPMPKTSRRRGRVQVVMAGDAEETQITYWTDEEAREWALRDAPARPGVTASQPAAAPFTLGQHPVTVTGDGRPPLHLVTSQAEPETSTGTDQETGLVGLSEAAEKGILTLSDDPRKTTLIARRARGDRNRRDPEFPQAKGKRGPELLYEPDDLRRWARNRPRNQADEQEDVSGAAR